MQRKRTPSGAASRAAADSAVRLGMEALKEQRATDAERMARDLLAQQPRHPGVLCLLGIALLAQQRPHDALSPLEQAAHLSQDAAIETHYAIALCQTGQQTEAIEWLQRAITRTPPFPKAFHELGVLFCSLRRYSEAEAVLKRGLEVAPSVAELSVELGGVYICRAESGNAMTAFARALANAPGHVRALHGFGTALLFEGDFTRAAERFRQVLTRNPNHVRAHLDLAHCLLELGQHQAAIEALQKVVRAAPALYGKALKVLVTSGRGQFWLRPSVAAAMLQFREIASPAAQKPAAR